MFFYTVACRFEGSDPETPKRWLNWLRDEHLADVCAAGAQQAEVITLDSEVPAFEVHYRFETRQAFEAYERDHAPRLREEGLERFPLDLGLVYSRRTGERVVG